jgi:MFS family permease
MSYRSNNAKNALHGFFLSIATTVAEPSTILPLIVHHFSSNLVLVGLFASLLRGGAIAVQLVAAFYAQSYARVMPLMRIVFLFRFLFWFLIGAAIHFVGDRNPALTLWLIGIGLFGFSFVAGFGGIYFKEIIAKVFTREQRGRTMADRQLWSSVGAIISGGIAGWVLQRFDAPENYAMLFMLSAFLMALGLVAFAACLDRFFLRRATWIETLLLLFGAIGLFWPDIVLPAGWSLGFKVIPAAAVNLAGLLLFGGAVFMQHSYTPEGFEPAERLGPQGGSGDATA